MEADDLTFETCQKLATEFLATKERVNYYYFVAFDDDWGTEHLYSNPLTDDEVAALRALKGKYGEEEYVKHLDEVFDDPDVIHDLTCGDELLEIDLDRVHHQYAVSLHEMLPDFTIKSRKLSIELRDEQYAALVAWHLYDEHLTINSLRLRDRKLHDVVINGVDSYACVDDDPIFIYSNPYLVTLDEAKADAELIFRQHGITPTPNVFRAI